MCGICKLKLQKIYKNNLNSVTFWLVTRDALETHGKVVKAGYKSNQTF